MIIKNKAVKFELTTRIVFRKEKLDELIANYFRDNSRCTRASSN